MGWYQPVNWFILTSDGAYHKVFKHTEQVAAAFKGATVKNLGPTLCANIDWQYVVWHLDLNFVHPENPGLGFDIGYELYWKGHDEACFVGSSGIANCGTGCSNNCSSGCSTNGSNGCSTDLCCTSSFITTAKDFLGVTKQLDPCVLAINTSQLAHKIRVEFFHRWNFCDVFAGWSQVFAGKNSMQETSWHIGMEIIW